MKLFLTKVLLYYYYYYYYYYCIKFKDINIHKLYNAAICWAM